MKELRFWVFAAISILFLPMPSASALVIIGDEAAHTLRLNDYTLTGLLPLAGEPWQYVARFDTNASGIYIGGGYVLTADHVPTPGSIFINGQSYLPDLSFNPVQIEPGVDLQLLRILGDPGLGPLPMVDANDVDLGRASTIIGWGAGKGDELPNQGWEWGLEDSRALRWGYNETLPQYDLTLGTPVLSTEFNYSAGVHESALALADSGAPLFQNFAGVWKLAGIATDAESNNASLYDQSGTPGPNNDVPDHNYFVPIKPYRDAIQEMTNLPEPGTLPLTTVAMILFLCSRSIRASHARKGMPTER